MGDALKQGEGDTQLFGTSRLRALTAIGVALTGVLAGTVAPATAATSSTGYTAYVPNIDNNVAGGDFETQLVSPGCGTNVALATLVNQWSRRGGSGTAYLRCGQQATFGLRHINYEHGQDWENIRVKYAQSGDWSSFMKNTTAANLLIPSRYVTYNVNNKDTYKGLLCIRSNSNNTVVRAYDVIIPVGADNSNIITSYPTNSRASDARC